MPCEKQPQTPNRVETRADALHPVIGVIDQHLPRISQIMDGFSKLAPDVDRQKHIAGSYGFLADSIAEAGPFTLEPTDLISIWDYADRIFKGSRYHGYALAGMVSTAFTIQEQEEPELKTLPRYFLENQRLPKDLKTNTEAMQDMTARTAIINKSLEEIKSHDYVPVSPNFNLQEHFGNEFTAFSMLLSFASGQF